MPTVKLTEKAVAKLQAPDPSGKQVLYWDGGGKESLPGFGVLCSGTTSVKSYIVQRTLPDGRTRRVTVAKVVELDLEEARKRAAKLLLDMRNGIDPKAGRGSGASTLRETLDAYVITRSSLAERSKVAYSDLVKRHLKEWLNKPLRDITPGMVEERYGDIRTEVKNAGR
jgi:hypothetical protein